MIFSLGIFYTDLGMIYFRVKKMQAGDVVKLNSDGPAMTIAWVNDDEAYCEWFDDKKPMGHTFQVTSLHKI